MKLLLRTDKLSTRALLAVVIFCSGCAMKIGKQPRQEVTPLYPAAAPEFRQSAGSLLGPNFVGGNKITTLINGDQIFPAMLSAIRSARRSVNFETYNFIDGEVAKQFTETLADAAHRRGSVLHGDDYFPPLESAGSSLAQAIRSGAHYENLDLLYLLGIAAAQKTLRIENAYFLPDDLVRKELVAAAKRGTKIEIIVPGRKIDQKLVRAASKRHWPELIQAGIKIYEYEPTMVHVKLLVVDDTFVSVGSGNFDDRSIRLNDEANLDVLDRQFAAEQIRFFEMDKRQSHEVTLEEASGFHFANPLEHLAGLFSPQL